MKTNDSAIINEVKEQGLKMFSVPRDYGGHGGLGVIFKPEVNIKLQTKNSTNLKRYKTFEYLECILKSEKGLLRFCNIYRRPYSKVHRFTKSQFLTEFEEYLTTLITKPGLPILLGDFNFHMEDQSDFYSTSLSNLLDQFCYKQNIPSNTSTQKQGGLLDLVLTCDEISSNVSQFTVHPEGTSSDHYMVSFDLDCSPELCKQTEKICYRNFNSIDIDKFKLDLMNSPLINVVNLPDEPENLDKIVDLYNEHLQKLMDIHCPLIHKTQKIKIGKDPWFDSELRELLRQCRAAERKWRKSQSITDKKLYKNLNKLYCHTLKLKRKVHTSASINNVKHNKRKLFKRLNKLMGKERSVLPSSNSDKDLAEDFSTYFSDKITKIRYDIDHEQEHNCAHLEDCNECCYQGDKLQQFQLLNQKDLLDLLPCMSNKFCCLDPIPTWLLMDCIVELGPVLLKIVNLSLQFGIFPNASKTAVIKPTVKDFKECTDSLTNYRPVSNISFISKLIEKAVLKQLNNHLEDNNLYCTSQSGYRHHHSCETLNIKSFDDMLKCMDEGYTVALLLLDMSAAFDTVDHSLLLQQLNENYGLTNSVLSWFENYLNNRTCSVHINETFSNIICLLFGVPQGSIVGPILFILYTKHIEHIAAKYGLRVQLYADDTQLYVGFESMNNFDINLCKERVENCLYEVKIWMCSKYLKLNEGKTKLLFLKKPYTANSSHDAEDASNFSLSVCSSDIQEVDWIKEGEIKSLGLRLDPQLKMINHISYLKKFCFGQIMAWKRIGYLLTEDVKLMLVTQIILSKIDYNNAVLAGLPSYMIDGLQSIVNCALRFVYNVRWRDHISPYIMKSHILPVTHRVDYKICVLVFNCLNGLAPEYLQNLLKWNVPTRSATSDIIRFDTNRQAPRTTQDPFFLTIPNDFGNRTRYRSRTFSHYAPRIWNKLTFELRTCSNKETFKKELKTYFFNLYIASQNIEMHQC